VNSPLTSFSPFCDEFMLERSLTIGHEPHQLIRRRSPGKRALGIVERFPTQPECEVRMRASRWNLCVASDDPRLGPKSYIDSHTCVREFGSGFPRGHAHMGWEQGH